MRPARKRLLRTSMTAAAVLALTCVAFSASAATSPSPAQHWRRVFQARTGPSKLTGVIALRAKDAWAVGSSRDGAVVMRWNGSSWRSVPLPGAAGFFPTAAAASSPGNVWVAGNVGGSDTGKIMRWNGSSWQPIALPTGVTAQSPVVLGPANAWVVGPTVCTGQANCTSQLLHWDGAGWTSFAVPASISSLAGSSTANMWATGWQDGLAARLAVYHWTGTTWKSVASAPHPRIESAGLAAPSAGHVWIGGWLATSRTPMFVLQWNGSRWAQHTAAIKPPGGAFQNASTTLAPDGYHGVWLGPWVHWTGATWISVPPGISTSAFDLTDIALIPRSRSLWGVGLRHRSAAHPQQSLIAVQGSMP
jgi:hypothetical protein